MGKICRVNYWEIVADNLSKAGWSWGCCTVAIASGLRYIVDVSRDARRFIVKSDELLTAFLELEATSL
jgi:uncharacterized metal-binding protein